MIFGTPRAPISRRLVAVLTLLPAVLLVAGCDPDPYPATMNYAPRGDLLVINAVGRDIPTTFGPGLLDQHMNNLREKAKEDPSKFKIGDPTELSDDQRGRIDEELFKRFGTPAAPTVRVTEDKELIKELALDDDTLAKGSILYRRHCLHCHGVTGDGRGPTSPWVNPPPRDYRRTLFKFTSHSRGQANAARRSDIIRTLQEGIEGTSMPTFKAQPLRDLEALASYVIHLAIRGSVEFYAIEESLKVNSEDAKNVPGMVLEKTNFYASLWKDNTPIAPHPYPAGKDLQKSIEDGYNLFIGKGICISCHVDFGRQSQFMYDKWGTLVRPNNLTQGVYRGGRRPIDFYYRIHSGIDPSTMPGATPEVASNPEAIWDLVNFVRTLPYPAMLPESVYQKVYGPSRGAPTQTALGLGKALTGD